MISAGATPSVPIGTSPSKTIVVFTSVVLRKWGKTVFFFTGFQSTVFPTLEKEVEFENALTLENSQQKSINCSNTEQGKPWSNTRWPNLHWKTNVLFTRFLAIFSWQLCQKIFRHWNNIWKERCTLDTMIGGHITVRGSTWNQYELIRFSKTLLVRWKNLQGTVKTRQHLLTNAESQIYVDKLTAGLKFEKSYTNSNLPVIKALLQTQVPIKLFLSLCGSKSQNSSDISREG